MNKYVFMTLILTAMTGFAKDKTEPVAVVPETTIVEKTVVKEIPVESANCKTSNTTIKLRPGTFASSTAVNFDGSVTVNDPQLMVGGDRLRLLNYAPETQELACKSMGFRKAGKALNTSPASRDFTISESFEELIILETSGYKVIISEEGGKPAQMDGVLLRINCLR